MIAIRRKVLGAAATAIAAASMSAAFSAPAFAASAGPAKPIVQASSSRGHSHKIIHFKGKPFELEVATQFRPIFTREDPNLLLSGGAKLVDGGFRLGGGSGTRDANGDVTENLRGTVIYTAPQSYTVFHGYTIHVTNFRLEATSHLTRAELVGDVKVTVLNRQPIEAHGLDLLDLQLTEGKVSFKGNSEKITNVPALLSEQAAQIAARVAPGMFMPGTFIADAQFSVPAP